MPDAASGPFQFQLPLAVQAVAFVLDHVIVDVPPEAIVDGVSVMVAVGVPAATVTVVEAGVEPPAPVHVSV